MNVKVFTAIPTGYSGQLIEVEGHNNKGLHSFNLVGMGDKTFFESKRNAFAAPLWIQISLFQNTKSLSISPP